MGRNRKAQLKRRIAQAYHALGNAVIRIDEVYEAFQPYHPHLAEGLKMAIATIILAEKIIEKFWESAWGKFPQNIDSWR